MIKIAKILVPLFLIAAVVGFGAWQLGLSDEASPDGNIAATQVDTTSDGSNTISDIQIATLEHSIDEASSLWLLVNKDRSISLDYVPDSLRLVDVTNRADKTEAELSMRDDAATALESLFAGAKTDDLDLLLGSGYRDSELQNFYYSNYVVAYGQAEADKFSAKPGTSEHQTGLVADVSPASMNCYLETCFSTTAEGKWVQQNAHKFGFVIRYPEGKESITGYQFEPWHLRYVGVQLATELFEGGQTMEEYFKLV